MNNVDPVALTAELIRCPSVTPTEGGAIALLENLLESAGFRCTRISRGGVENLYARWGSSAPVFAFAGHTDVVPVGNPDDWASDPFSGHLADGRIWGRGACDMKSGVAAFVAAAIAKVSEAPPEGSISLLITGDEEGPATDGTIAILDWMRAAGETADFCVVGEPTSAIRLGDVIKIGRRGSMTGTLVVSGRQGHTAYPERAENPLPMLAAICERLSELPIDLGSTHFQPTTLALSTIDVGNTASNVIPASGRAVFNVRFNDLQTPETVRVWANQIVTECVRGTDCHAEVTWQVSGESFLTEPGPLVDIAIDAITDRMLERPALTTGGGTSDARFIKDLCPVVEIGLVGDSMHQVNESSDVGDIQQLSTIYRDILNRFFGG